MVIRALTRPSRPMCALAAIGAIAFASPTKADLCNIATGARLLPSALTPSAWFGNSVGLTGSYAVVGAPLLMVEGLATGAAYVYARTGSETWLFDGALIGSEVMPFDNLGWSVAIDGTTAIVGAWGDDELGADAGAAYIFVREKEGWVEQARLTASDGAAGDNFGWSVAIHADTAIVGAWFDDDRGTNSGAAYIFVRSGDTWTQQTKLTASNGQANDLFGSSVAIHAERAVVGAYLNDAAATNAGAAYVFEREGGTWTQQGILTAPDAGANDFFGLSVSCHEGRILVGAPRSDPTFLDAGAAYVFVRPNNFWVMEAKLTAANGRMGDQLGYAVALRGGAALLGAPGDDDEVLGSNAGSASYFFFSDSEWLEGAKLLDPAGAEDNQAGLAVALGDSGAIVGSYLDDAMEMDGGSARLYYDFFCGPPGPCEGDADGNGTVDIDDVTFVLLRFGLCPNEPECTSEQGETLFASDGTEGDNFGGSVAISGNTAVVGAARAPNPNNPSNVIGVQVAYVYERTGPPGSEVWSEQAILGSGIGSGFGRAVAIDGDTIVIGAPKDSEFGFDSGAAYIFVRDGAGWVQQAKLVPSNPQTSAYFGYSVAISGDTILIGAPRAEEPAGFFRTGAAYVFTRSGGAWTEQAQLSAPTPQPDDFFGFSVALAGDTAAIGARLRDGFAPDQGAVFVFARTGPPGSEVWIYRTELFSPLPGSAYHFGHSLSMSGNTILASEYILGNSMTPTSSYVFVRIGPPDTGTWSIQGQLIAPAAGISNTLSDDVALVVRWPPVIGPPCTVFHRTGNPSDPLNQTWTQRGFLIPDFTGAISPIIQSMALDGEDLLIGVPSTGGVGRVATYNLRCITEFECPGDMDNNGVVDVDDLTFVILRLGTCL